MSNPNNQIPNQQQPPFAPQGENSGSANTEAPPLPSEGPLPSGMNEGLTEREREELLMYDYIVNHPELYEQDVQPFKASPENKEDVPPEDELCLGTEEEFEKYENFKDLSEEDQYINPEWAQINSVALINDGDMNPFAGFGQSKTVKIRPFLTIQKQIKNKIKKLFPSLPIYKEKKKEEVNEEGKKKIINHWSINKQFLPTKTEIQELAQSKVCCPLPPRHRKMKQDTATVEYQKYINPHLEHWETSNQRMVHFNRVITIKEFNKDATPASINQEAEQYEILQLPPVPSHAVEVITKCEKVQVKEIKEETKKGQQQQLQAAPLNVDLDFGSPFEEDFYFQISEEDEDGSLFDQSSTQFQK